MDRKFRLSYSLWWTFAALVFEALAVVFVPAAAMFAVLCVAALGAMGNLYVAIEVVEEVHLLRRMAIFLSIVLADFVIFFAFQYHFMLHLSPQSFPSLGGDPASLVLQSLMVFVFNPLYIPADTAGRTLLIINTLASLGLVFLVLQNIWQLRRKQP